MDLLTLETMVPSYTFDGQLPSKTFTAHPKLDSMTGNMVAFGYEAEGFGSKTVSIFEITPQGKIVWNAKIQVPYVGMLHDFAVTEKHIVFYVIPLAIDEKQMDGAAASTGRGIRAQPTYFGFVRRGGDGKDVQWIKGPTRSATHVMGTFDDGKKLLRRRRDVDGESVPVHADARRLALGSGRGLEPHHAPVGRPLEEEAVGVRHRAAVSARRRAAAPGRSLQHRAVSLRLPAVPGSGTRSPARAARATRASIIRTAPSTLFNAGTDSSLAECCFAPKQRERAGGLGLSDGCRDAQRRGRPRGSRDPRRRASRTTARSRPCICRCARSARSTAGGCRRRSCRSVRKLDEHARPVRAGARLGRPASRASARARRCCAASRCRSSARSRPA